MPHRWRHITAVEICPRLFPELHDIELLLSADSLKVLIIFFLLQLAATFPLEYHLSDNNIASHPSGMLEILGSIEFRKSIYSIHICFASQSNVYSARYLFMFCWQRRWCNYKSCVVHKNLAKHSNPLQQASETVVSIFCSLFLRQGLVISQSWMCWHDRLQVFITTHF